jgi:hypothetical protein
MKYILITLGVVLLIIFGIVIINRGGGKTAVLTGKKVIKLTDYATNNNALMRYNIEGPINALENHRSMQVDVGPTSRSITIFTGYQGQVLTTQSYPNDGTAYSAFLAALNRAGFTRERRLDASTNSDSVCPTANRTHYIVSDNNKDAMNLWSASCTAGSFNGNTTLTQTLFKSQIPNYSAFVNSVSASSGSAGIY